MKNNEQQPILTGTSSHEVQSNPVIHGERKIQINMKLFYSGNIGICILLYILKFIFENNNILLTFLDDKKEKG